MGKSDEDKVKLHLNGNQALAFARLRYVGNSDYERTERQRRVISEIITEAKKLNLVQLDKLLNKVLPEINTDLTDGEIANLLLNAFDYMNYDIQQLRIPADGYFTNEVIYSMDVLNPDFAANSAFIQYIVYGSCKNIDEAIKQYQEEKKELLESLELYYRVFFLGEEVPEEALMEEDGEKPNGK